MGMAKLNIWVRDQYSPCRPDMRYTWSVDVFLCDGTPLVWCGTKYYGAHHTKCGHVEIEVPPGCYIVRARTGSKGHHNLFSHMTLVIVGCGDTACVNLIAPGTWVCGKQFTLALEFLAKNGLVPREAALEAIKANNVVIEHMPKAIYPAEEFDSLGGYLKMTAAEEDESEQ